MRRERGKKKEPGIVPESTFPRPHPAPARCIIPTTRHARPAILSSSSFVRESTGVFREARGLIQGYTAWKQDGRGTAWEYPWLLVELIPRKAAGFLIPQIFSDQTDTHTPIKEIAGSPWPR